MVILHRLPMHVCTKAVALLAVIAVVYMRMFNNVTDTLNSAALMHRANVQMQDMLCEESCSNAPCMYLSSAARLDGGQSCALL